MENKQNLLSKEKTQKQNRIWVRIAAACNNKCIFCLDSDAQNGTFPSDDKIKLEIKNGYKEGYENRVIISGGEASINPKFPLYIKYAKEVGYDRVQTVTNGNMFFLEKFCEKVFNAGLEEVTFSFHGHTPKLHDYLVATPGAFKKSLKGLIYVKKHFPNVIINIDIVVNKINVPFLPDIVKFFMRLGVYEYDILQIIPFGRGFSKYWDQLFYNIADYQNQLKETWKLASIPGMYMWTNRFPAEAFEGHEDLVQDPRKIKSEVMGEGIATFSKFIKSKGKNKPECYGNACKVCFINQYCHGYLNNINKDKVNLNEEKSFILKGEEFPSQVYKNYGENKSDFIKFLENKKNESYNLINVPKCLGGTGVFETYNDLDPEFKIEDYTPKYINNLYRKKSLRCKKCKHNKDCEGIGINFIRSYGFDILKPILNHDTVNTFISSIPSNLIIDKIPLTLSHYQRFFDYILKNIDKTSNILEVGCYFGLGIIELDTNGYNVSGIDFEKDIIEYSYSKGLDVLYGDIRTVNLNKKYDFIYLVNFVHDDNSHITNFYEFFSIIFNNLNELLNVGGKILFNFQEINGLFYEKDLKEIIKIFNIVELDYDKLNGRDKMFLLIK